jgi:hypothetical protein
MSRDLYDKYPPKKYPFLARICQMDSCDKRAEFFEGVEYKLFAFCKRHMYDRLCRSVEKEKLLEVSEREVYK